MLLLIVSTVIVTVFCVLLSSFVMVNVRSVLVFRVTKGRRHTLQPKVNTRSALVSVMACCSVSRSLLTVIPILTLYI